MDAYVYQAALLCADCGQAAIIAVESTRPFPPGYPSDSDAYPQGPYPQGGGEADSPQHCDHCSLFLENPLTGDGYAYVAELIEEHLDNGRGSAAVLRTWADFYASENDGLDAAVQRWQDERADEWNALS